MVRTFNAFFPSLRTTNGVNNARRIKSYERSPLSNSPLLQKLLVVVHFLRCRASEHVFGYLNREKVLGLATLRVGGEESPFGLRIAMCVLSPLSIERQPVRRYFPALVTLCRRCCRHRCCRRHRWRGASAPQTTPAAGGG